MALPRDILDIHTLYMEPAVETYDRGRQVLERYPEARRIVVPSHNDIPTLYGNEGNAEDWLRIKQHTLVLGVKKSMSMRPNERSSNFIAPSTSNGCAMACAYCYVPRRKGYANPITIFVNIEQICAALARHAKRQGVKPAADQVDPDLWVYDLGENGDLSVDALVSDNVRDLIATFRHLPNAKGSFATKYVNRDLLGYDPQKKTRIRFSLMPEAVAHETLSSPAKEQLKAEVIFLTHNAALHEVNLRWHPRAEDWLWRPELQQKKLSQNGMWNLRYKVHEKRRYVESFLDALRRTLPGCEVRYAF